MTLLPSCPHGVFVWAPPPFGYEPISIIPTKIPTPILPPLHGHDPMAVAFDTCTPSTIELLPERTTPSHKFPEIHPFRRVMPVGLFPASIAMGNAGDEPPLGEVPLIVKPARSIVTSLR